MAGQCRAFCVCGLAGARETEGWSVKGERSAEEGDPGVDHSRVPVRESSDRVYRKAAVRLRGLCAVV